MSQAFSLVVAVSLLAAAAPQPGVAAPGPAIGTVHFISQSAQGATRAFWTAARIGDRHEGNATHVGRKGHRAGRPTRRPARRTP